MEIWGSRVEHTQINNLANIKNKMNMKFYNLGLMVFFLLITSCSKRTDFDKIIDSEINRLEVSSWNVMRRDYNYKGELNFENNEFNLTNTFIEGDKKNFKFPKVGSSQMNELKTILSQIDLSSDLAGAPEITITVSQIKENFIQKD